MGSISSKLSKRFKGDKHSSTKKDVDDKEAETVSLPDPDCEVQVEINDQTETEKKAKRSKSARLASKPLTWINTLRTSSSHKNDKKNDMNEDMSDEPHNQIINKKTVTKTSTKTIIMKDKEGNIVGKPEIISADCSKTLEQTESKEGGTVTIYYESQNDEPLHVVRTTEVSGTAIEINDPCDIIKETLPQEYVIEDKAVNIESQTILNESNNCVKQCAEINVIPMSNSSTQEFPEVKLEPQEEVIIAIKECIANQSEHIEPISTHILPVKEINETDLICEDKLVTQSEPMEMEIQCNTDGLQNEFPTISEDNDIMKKEEQPSSEVLFDECSKIIENVQLKEYLTTEESRSEPKECEFNNEVVTEFKDNLDFNQGIDDVTVGDHHEKNANSELPREYSFNDAITDLEANVIENTSIVNFTDYNIDMEEIKHEEIINDNIEIFSDHNTTSITSIDQNIKKYSIDETDISCEIHEKENILLENNDGNSDISGIQNYEDLNLINVNAVNIEQDNIIVEENIEKDDSEDTEHVKSHNDTEDDDPLDVVTSLHENNNETSKIADINKCEDSHILREHTGEQYNIHVEEITVEKANLNNADSNMHYTLSKIDADMDSENIGQHNDDLNVEIKEDIMSHTYTEDSKTLNIETENMNAVSNEKQMQSLENLMDSGIESPRQQYDSTSTYATVVPDVNQHGES